MKLIETSKKVLRYISRNSFDGYQILVKEYIIFGITIWRKTLDREEVPSWASIQIATLGSCEWKSKFHEIINNEH